MIYTVTLNPSLDYIIDVKHFEPGMVNRTTAEKIFAVRDCLGRFFHCPEQNIVFTNNCTTAVNLSLIHI